MKQLFKKLKADKIIKLGTYFSSGIIAGHLAFVLFFYNSLPPFIPLYNQMPWGRERLGTKIEIFLPLLINIVFFSINLYLALYIYNKMPLLSRILSISALLICILTFIFILRIITLII